MLLCEAAGFDVILIETVGVGQSETIVAEMVDFFLVLMLAGAGDELQGIKKGVLEIADLLAVNKADGDNRQRAERSAAEYRAALHLLTPATPTWTPPVMTCSGLSGEGLGPVWDQVLHHRAKLGATGELDEKRRAQQIRWFWSMLRDELLDRFRRDPAVVHLLPDVEANVSRGTLAPTVAVEQVLNAFQR
jgi:LAO/AO transport system kinase